MNPTSDSFHSKVKQQRTPGTLKGRINVTADFDAALPTEILEKFYEYS